MTQSRQTQPVWSAATVSWGAQNRFFRTLRETGGHMIVSHVVRVI